MTPCALPIALVGTLQQEVGRYSVIWDASPLLALYAQMEPSPWGPILIGVQIEKVPAGARNRAEGRYSPPGLGLTYTPRPLKPRAAPRTPHGAGRRWKSRGWGAGVFNPITKSETKELKGIRRVILNRPLN